MATDYQLKPFYLNLNDLLYLLQQVNFVPLFDGPANSNGIVNFNAATMDAWDANGNQVWDAQTQAGSYRGTALTSANVGLLGQGFPQVSAPIGIRDVSGLHNNLFGDQAFWGTVDVPFRRDIAADFNNYVTTPGADYAPGNNVIDYMPRIISQTITTGGVNLLKDANGHFVEWSEDRYILDNSYAALIDASGVDINNLVEGAKVVAPSGLSLTWDPNADTASVAYHNLLATFAATASADGRLYGSDTGGVVVDGGALYVKDAGGAYVPIMLGSNPLSFSANLFLYHDLVTQAGGPPANPGDTLTVTPADLKAVETALDATFVEVTGAVSGLAGAGSGYGLLEQLGHIDFQNPNSGEYFIGSENPGVAPVNSWFGIFGQFFDHGLDLIGKGGNGKITIQLDPSDPLYRAPGTNGPGDLGVTKMTVTRATIAGTDANGDPNYVNHTSPFIDQSQTYGSADQITQLLRKWVPDASGGGYHAGMELFDGATLVDAWERRWPDGSSTMVHDTLPTLTELRDHVLDTGRSELTWEDVSNYRNRDASGQLSAGDSGHALILDMNPNFDGAHFDSTAAVGNTTVAALVDAAVAALNASLTGSGMTFGQNVAGNIELAVTGGAGGANLPDGTYTGAFALAPWVNFSDFSINLPAGALHDAVGQILMATVGDHYVAGDGRVNENFGLTSIHHVFHEEHNYQVENLKSWIYKHDANNPGGTDSHEQLHNWQVNTLSSGGSLDAQGNYRYASGEIAWDADKMFNATKLLVEMEYQHAAVDQYARTVTPRIQEFVGYSTGVDATVSLEYSQVAFRFGHSTIRETIDTIDPSGWMLGNVTRFALEKAFLAPQTFAQEGVAAITLGLSRQQMNEVDEFVTPALTQGLLDQPLDLAAINIARGRDLGIPTLNDFREGISLARYISWDDFGKNMIHPESLVNFIAAYSFGGNGAKAQAILGLFDGTIAEGSAAAMGFTASDAAAFMLNNAAANAELNTARDGFDHIDSWIGGLAEAHVPGGLLGETFDAVFVAQIQSLMDGDRFYYLYRLFGTNIHEEVNNGQFKDIVERNTGLSHLNGSIFAYADKYYEFGRAADGTLTGAGDDLANHLYHDTLDANPTLGIFSDGGASTAPNGSIISVTGSDFVRADVTNQYIRDVRPELDPNQVHTVEGTPTSGADSHEVIVATDNADYIHARSGDDTVYGEGGNDFIYGDGGVDRLYGGAGDDMIDTGEGPDLADGGAGKDIIYGRGSGSEVGGFDQLVGGSGNDLIVGGEGIDKLSGGAGDDIMYGDGLTNPEMGNTDPFTHGGDGNDYIDGGASGDLLYGEEGDDVLVGGNDQDLIQGGVGDDILRPGQPSQAIGGGPDEVIGDDGYTNNGFDLIDFSDYPVTSAGGVTFTLDNQTNPLVAIDGTTPMPAVFQIEGIIGSRNNDDLSGDSSGDPTAVFSHGNNWLVGGSGGDTLQGNGGNDLLIGGSVRLDWLIGKYSDAANASGPGNLALGSTEWLTDAMHSGSTGGVNDGYDNDAESAYTGASNRANGALSGGFLTGAGFDLHFTEMLRSRMFKDIVLGDGGTDGLDTAKFVGNRNEYSIVALNAAGQQTTVAADVVGFKVTDSQANRTLDDGTVVEGDGSDLLVGVDFAQFANQTVNLQLFAPTGSVGFTANQGNNNVTLSGNSLLFDLNNATPNNPLGAVQNNQVTFKWYEGATGTAQQIGNPPSLTQLTQGQTAGHLVHLQATYIDGLGLTEVVNSPAWNLVVGTAGNDAALNGTDVSDGVGGTYADVIFGLGGNDTINGNGGHDLLYGGSGNDTINGGAGNDLLDGGTNNNTGGDTMAGGQGDDTYVVDDASGGNGNVDVVTEGLNAGTDIVMSSVSYALTANVENLTLVNVGGGGGGGGGGANNINATGNTLANVLTGNSGNNTLDGAGGTDTAAFSGSELSATATINGAGNVAINIPGQGGGGGGGGGGGSGADTLISIEQVRFGTATYTLVLGTNGANAAVNGGASNDFIVAGQGSDTVNGNAGDDVIVWTATGGGGGGGAVLDGRDIVHGGTNATATSRGDTFVVNGNNQAETFRIYTALEAAAAGIAGINAAAEIVVTRSVTVNGNTTTTVVGELDGIEELQINTGGGNDVVEIVGNFNPTHLNYNTITIDGGDGDDNVDIRRLSSNHRIVFETGPGNDTVTGNLRPQDILHHDGGPAATSGNEGDDDFEGTSGDDNIETGSGHDHVAAGSGDDQIRASANDGNDSYDGGDGIDTYDASDITTSVTIDLATGRSHGPQTGSDRLVSVENAIGGEGNDHISGSNADNNLSGGGGRDFITGLGGDDRISGGKGDDDLRGGNGNDVIQGGDGDDQIYGGLGGNDLSGGDGKDRIWGGERSDRISGGAGDDYLDGGMGDDSIQGEAGNDSISGRAGADNLGGGDGSDTIDGGSGNDRMSGGTGSDRFVFERGFGNDVITDFDADARGGQDYIDLRALGITAGNFGTHVQIANAGQDTIVKIDGNEIRLKGIADFHDITQSDFVLFAG